MKIVYFSNAVLNESGLEERILVTSQAGNLRSRHIYDIISKCNKNTVFLSQGPGKMGGIKKTVNKRPLKEGFSEIYLGYIGEGIIQWISSIILTTFWLFRNISQDDIVITYNFMPQNSIPIICTKLFKRYRLVIEFEELYGLMDMPHGWIYKTLEDYGIKKANAFIASSHHIADEIQRHHEKPIDIAISHGYFNNTQNTQITNPPNKGRLKILYSGTLNEERGISNLITLMTHVRDFADLLITGNGPLSSIIDNSQSKNENIQYFGYLNDQEFNKLLKSVHICINPTLKESNFAKCSFPSKIVYYLSNSKIVLSTQLSVIQRSEYNDMIIYFDENDPLQFREKLLEIWKNFDKLSENSKEFPEKLESIQKREYSDICKLLNKK